MFTDVCKKFFGIVIVLCIAIILLINYYLTKDQFETFGNNGQNCIYKDKENCLLIAGNVCNWCNTTNKCYDKYSKDEQHIKNHKCNDSLNNSEILKIKNKEMLIFAKDIYDSTQGHFDWEDWYNNYIIFPPFIYNEGRYYFSPENTECLYDEHVIKYKYLESPGVNSAIYNNWYHDNRTVDEKTIESVRYFRDIGSLGRKILKSLNIDLVWDI